MANSIVIRKGRIKDAEKTLPIWDQFMEYHRRISAFDFEMVDNAREMWVRYFKRHVRSRTRKAIVAERDGEIVGFLLGEIQKRPPIFVALRQAYVDSIGVLEPYQSQGIGSRMLDAFAAWARGQAMPYIMLYVAVENDAAKHFYEKHGFRPMMLSERKLLQS
jgi:ribosomal protein S18 acetylase RimI-like enzyme